MVAAGKIASVMETWSEPEAKRQNKLLEKARLPLTIPPQLDKQAIIAALQNDKKVQAGKMRFVIPTEIGLVTISDRGTTGVIETAI